MKTLKTISLCLVVTVLGLILSCTSEDATEEITSDLTIEKINSLPETVAVEENGTIRIVNKNAIKSIWEAQLHQDGFYDIDLENFIITEGDLNKDGEQVLILMATSKDGTIKMATPVERAIGTIPGSATIKPAGFSVSCTSTCNTGCTPGYAAGTDSNNPNNWSCSACISQPLKRCTKTITVTVEAGN